MEIKIARETLDKIRVAAYERFVREKCSTCKHEGHCIVKEQQLDDARRGVRPV